MYAPRRNQMGGSRRSRKTRSGNSPSADSRDRRRFGPARGRYRAEKDWEILEIVCTRVRIVIIIRRDRIPRTGDEIDSELLIVVDRIAKNAAPPPVAHAHPAAARFAIKQTVIGDDVGRSYRKATD